MQYAFLFSNFLWSTYGSPWLQLSAQGKLGVLSQQACSAFSQVTFGRHHARPDFTIVGAVQYGQAVSKVRAGLGDSSNPAFADLLVPVFVFLLYSSSSAASQQESQSHVMGLHTILRIAGTKAFRMPMLRTALSSCRATLVTVGLLRKMRLFSEEESWKEEPWSLNPASKGHQDQLVDILVHVPGFLQDQQALRMNIDQRGQSVLAANVLYQLGTLFKWRWMWASAHPSAAKNVSSSSRRSSPSNTTKCFLQYSSFETAVEIALYNAALLCLLDVLYSELAPAEAQRQIDNVAINARTRSNSVLNSALTPPLAEMVSMQLAAAEIVRSFEYQLAHIRGNESIPALFWLFPLGLASKVLRRDAEWTQWIQKMLDTSEVTRGYGRGDNSFGFGFYELPDVSERS